ncbi:hypothetical protein COT94_00500 [Candidatus Falkowbacteria bacterium CG10_big_fil_rev_8_21_14_0_10_37_14]|uniref:Uncharacterized protein n=1 Tax=Candidatus Falkowbacteria bacterium CG10_big_fil_rev_8_21_14_0_10_37_14 TaxID=1974561 RepID=A0A2M6WUE7_9BACT|nr:hypothetical protein [Candidatus Falkowbacteria bacterium]PIT96428.1 MAG: hypothetical protein COT94_00500 [Candidatus Falkowbacteria bacterium CG10_big_fil_rev_8_21_14_0_10_37_14]
MAKITRTEILEYVVVLFKVLFVGLLIFIFLEIIAPRSVLSILNLSAWFIFCVISGIIVIVWGEEK